MPGGAGLFWGEYAVTAWGVDGHTCVRRPLQLLGAGALERARVQACRGTCV